MSAGLGLTLLDADVVEEPSPRNAMKQEIITSTTIPGISFLNGKQALHVLALSKPFVFCHDFSLLSSARRSFCAQQPFGQAVATARCQDRFTLLPPVCTYVYMYTTHQVVCLCFGSRAGFSTIPTMSIEVGQLMLSLAFSDENVKSRFPRLQVSITGSLEELSVEAFYDRGSPYIS